MLTYGTFVYVVFELILIICIFPEDHKFRSVFRFIGVCCVHMHLNLFSI